MKLGEVKHIKSLCGERMHVYAKRCDGSRIDLFNSWAYLLPDSLNGHKVLRMSYDMYSGWIDTEINW